MKVLVIDYGMGNLGSVRRSLEECGADVIVSRNVEDLKEATHMILPGVGAFRDGMANLHRMNWIPGIRKAVKEGVPLLGICLGMQLLARRGFEGGEVEGLGFVPGEVKRLIPDKEGIRIPHVGWNEVYPEIQSPLFEGICPGTDFYFVHSYHMILMDEPFVWATTPYCGRFVSAVGVSKVTGVQFHPEKSSRPGMRFLKNYLSWGLE